MTTSCCCLPSIEFRNAFDHERRVSTVVLGIDLSNQEKSGLRPFEYCQTNLTKAIGHVYRAGYDALEVIAVSLIDEIDRIRNSVRRTTLIEVIADYSNVVTEPREAAQRLCDSARTNKDVEDLQVAGQYFTAYEEGIETLEGLRALLTTHLPDLQAVDKEKDRNVETQRNVAIVTSVVAVIGIIVTILVAMFKAQ